MDEKLLSKEKRLRLLFILLIIITAIIFLFSFTFIFASFISYIVSILSLPESGVENSDILAFLLTIFWQYFEHAVQLIWIALIQFALIALLVTFILLLNRVNKKIHELTLPKSDKPIKNQFAYSFMDDIVDDDEEENN